MQLDNSFFVKDVDLSNCFNYFLVFIKEEYFSKQNLSCEELTAIWQ